MRFNAAASTPTALLNDALYYICMNIRSIVLPLFIDSISYKNKLAM